MESPICPYCQSPMTAGYFLVRGGVWFCESKERIESHLREFTPEEYAALPKALLHALVPNRGAKSPKAGHHCLNCRAFVMHPQR
jgi:hypothetical protein